VAAPVARYGTVAIVLHWAIALGIVGLIAIGLTMDHLDIGQLAMFRLYQLHKSIGITVMLLIVLRIGWRLAHRAPPLPSGMRRGERVAAHGVHALLYALQIALPLSGWAMVSASVFAIPTVLFGVLPWPDLPVLPGLHDKAPVEAALKGFHHWAAWILTGAIVLHAAAALRHHFIAHDGILARMLPARPRRKASTP